MLVQISYRVFAQAKLNPNPAADIDLNQQNTRERVLTLSELRAVWAGAETLGYPYGTLVQLLTLTAARRAEIGSLRWSEIDFANAELVLPPARVKNRRGHSIPLAPEAVRILKDIPRSPGSELVFPVDFASKFQYRKQQLDELVNIAPWTLHDLRRSMASHLGDDDLNTDPLVIEKLLNHHGVLRGVSAIYQRQKLKRKVRSAVESYARYLLSGGAEIIPLAQHRA